MWISKCVPLALGVALIAVSVVQTTSSASPASRSVNVPAGSLKFYRNRDGLTFANAWGDPEVGPHSNYIRLPGRGPSPLHLHSSDYYGIVISGIVSNQRRNEADHPLSAGSYWYQQAGEAHTTKCLSRSDCLIFVTSQGKFDIQMVSDPALPGAGR